LVGDIKTIGIDNIVQIYTNNASSMKSAIDFLIHRFQSLYHQGYTIHCLDFLLEDGGNNMGEMNCEKMKVVVSFI
jgi:hypothetical protein